MAQGATAIRKDIQFSWVGTDKRGNKLKGRSLASSEQALRAELRRQGVIPVRISKQSNLFKGGGKVKPEDLAIFTRQLSTMLTAGIPLVQAFEIIGNGQTNRDASWCSASKPTSARTSLHESLAKHPLHFDDLYVNLVEAGEQAGALENLLDKIATYKEKTEALKKKIKKALFYPAAVVVVALVVTAILLIYVIPEFESLFQGFGADLLRSRRWSSTCRASCRIRAGCSRSAVGAFIALREMHQRSRAMRELIDRMSLKMPIIGPILTKAAIARYARTLSTMFSAGVPLVEALDSVSGATGNIVYSQAVLRMKDEVATGQRLQRAMENTGLFPNMVVR
jgi:type IV pilus assembly protein PilC